VVKKAFFMQQFCCPVVIRLSLVTFICSFFRYFSGNYTLSLKSLKQNVPARESQSKPEGLKGSPGSGSKAVLDTDATSLLFIWLLKTLQG
jgi:hypothetical protein